MKTREETLADQRAWYQKNKEKHLVNTKKYAKAHPDKSRGFKTRRFLYGLTEQELDDMEWLQNYLCLYCGIDMQGKYCVDHDHTCCPGKRSCGKCVIGLCCRGCNNLSSLLDKPELLKRMVVLREANRIERTPPLIVPPEALAVLIDLQENPLPVVPILNGVHVEPYIQLTDEFHTDSDFLLD